MSDRDSALMKIDLVRVEPAEAAQQQHFVDSPSIRLNGEDHFTVDHQNYALGCRVYQTTDGMRGWPTLAMRQNAISDRLVQ